ncbi:MAG: hypothetical protein C4K49_06090 [Candidatus Thorarchaeota archaeon]|nr:MAG: hypothetical protein C4K49_06090 [Candidatus Thorarchaeota archaeon]
MQTQKDNKKPNTRYTQSYDLFLRLADKVMSNRPWRKLGLFSYYDAPYFDSESVFLSPKQVMVAMAKEAAREDKTVVFVMDALEEGSMGFSAEADFRQFMTLFDEAFPDSMKFYFGPADSDKVWLHSLEHLKIPASWLVKKPYVFAEVLTDASPTGEDWGPGDVSFEDMSGLHEVLVEKLGPPSLTEEVLEKMRKEVASKTRGIGASDYAGEAIGLLVSPGTAVTHGVKYLGKLLSTVKDRRKKEVKDVYLEWRQRVDNAYSRDNLDRFFDSTPEYDSRVVAALLQKKPVLVITETRDTLFDAFLPLLLQNLMDEIGYVPPGKRPRFHTEGEKPASGGTEEEQSDGQTPMDYERAGVDESELPPVTGRLMMTMMEEASAGAEHHAVAGDDSFGGKPRVIILLDAATHLSNFERSFRSVLRIPERFPNMSVAASFFTNRETMTIALQEGVLEYISNRALVMDLNPALFEAATSKLPVSKKAWLEGRLREMAGITSNGGAAFLEYYASADEPWALRVLKKPRLGLAKRVFHWLGRQK